ncbi:MAG: FtsX-like permease family protein, partial [Spirochaetales bacterium]|nr:FtsX-like permease family protein [Spirochaetales bacterium]
QLNAAVGDNILVKLTTSTGQVNVGEFILKGISIDPGMMGFSGCYANLEYVNELLNIGRNESTLLGIFLNDFKKIDIEMDRLYTALSQKVNLFERTSDKEGFASLRGGSIEGEWEGMKYQLLSINDLLSRLNQLSDILNIVGVVVLLILLLIIMVGITNTFRMIIHERIREIGTMRALGMQRDGVRNIFLFEAFFLSLGGAAAGFLAALIIMFCVSLIEFGMGPLFIVMKNGHFYFNIIPAQVILYFALVAGMTLAAAFIPARKAARIDPAHALRTIY